MLCSRSLAFARALFALCSHSARTLLALCLRARFVISLFSFLSKFLFCFSTASLFHNMQLLFLPIKSFFVCLFYLFCCFFLYFRTGNCLYVLELLSFCCVFCLCSIVFLVFVLLFCLGVVCMFLLDLFVTCFGLRSCSLCCFHLCFALFVFMRFVVFCVAFSDKFSQNGGC